MRPPGIEDLSNKEKKHLNRNRSSKINSEQNVSLLDELITSLLSLAKLIKNIFSWTSSMSWKRHSQHNVWKNIVHVSKNKFLHNSTINYFICIFDILLQ